MAKFKCYKTPTPPVNPEAGAIWFNTQQKSISIYNGSAWESSIGSIKDIEYSNDSQVLTITKIDDSQISLGFSDIASKSETMNALTEMNSELMNLIQTHNHEGTYVTPSEVESMIAESITVALNTEY